MEREVRIFDVILIDGGKGGGESYLVHMTRSAVPSITEIFC